MGKPPKKRVEKNSDLSVEEALKATISLIEKTHGAGTVIQFQKNSGIYLDKIDIIPTGMYSLDLALGVGGYPRGRICEIFGAEGCLDSETFIQYQVTHTDGIRANCKGGTIKRLWDRFHKRGRRCEREETKNAYFCAPSINEKSCVIQNKILDVVKTGKKECFEVVTTKGNKIITTEDHKFFTGIDYKELKTLTVGDVVFVHLRVPFKKENKKERNNYPEIFVKSHPIAVPKIVRSRISWSEPIYKDYTYKRLRKSHAVVEASMNNLSLEEYIKRLNDNKLDSLLFLKKEDHVHHIDNNALNNSIENLKIVSGKEHGKLHATENHNNLRFVATEDTILSITPVGERETFDLKMQPPYHNFVANKFVVHNSGKTTCMLHAVAEAQKLGLICVYIDMEHALDIAYAEKLGVDVEKLLIAQPTYGEQALDVLETFVDSGLVGLIIVDSVAALVPKSELDGEMLDQNVGVMARMMSKVTRKIAGLVHKTNTTVIFVNQTRHKIGVIYGSPTTTVGGDALKFYSTVRLEIKRTGAIKDGSSESELKGNRTQIKVIKNKVAAPFKVVECDLIFGEGFSELSDILDLAVDKNIVKKAGGNHSWGDVKLGRSREDSLQYLKDHSETVDELKSLILNDKEIKDEPTSIESI